MWKSKLVLSSKCSKNITAECLLSKDDNVLSEDIFSILDGWKIEQGDCV